MSSSSNQQQSYLGLFVSTVGRVFVPQTLMAVGIGYLTSIGSAVEDGVAKISVSKGIADVGAVMTMANMVMLPPALAILHQSEKIATRIAAAAAKVKDPP